MTATDRPSFVYVTYIRTSAEELWRALTDPGFTERYWGGTRVVSDWKIGSRVALWLGDQEWDSGVVLDCDPPRRLSYSWKVGHSGFEHEAPSRVTFEIKPIGEQVQLKLTHDDFEPGSKVFEAVSTGWPMLMASLKSMLETGRVLTMGLQPGGEPYALEEEA
jgi:uncharacterized protein YndB with AHSA1/START domain